jgi:hypothetical protein
MPVDSDAKLTALAAEILRDEVRVYDQDDIDRWLGISSVLSGWNASMIGDAKTTGAFLTITAGFPVVTGAFPDLTGGLYATSGTEPDIALKRVFHLPDRLPGLRLPSGRELAGLARSARVMTQLDALARWLGQDGRPVTETDDLYATDAVKVARVIGVQDHYLPYLWEYALASRWVELSRTADGNRATAKVGPTARRWADGDDAGALHVWAVVFAVVLATTFEVASLGSWRRLSFQGSGVVATVMLFLARRTGLTLAEFSDILKDRIIGIQPRSRTRREWDAWVLTHGDPARWLLRELVDLHAVTVPESGDEAFGLTPVAQWAFRVQLRREGVEIPLLKPVATAEMSAASLVGLSDAIPEAQFDQEFAQWLAARGADRGARDLLIFATFTDSRSRLAAVNLVRRIGVSARDAWRDAMERPELRGYARMALSDAADDMRRYPDDFTWIATDMLAMACGEKDPDPGQIAVQFADAVPKGSETWVFGLMSHSSHPDVARVLSVLGRYHPDRRVARGARKAARIAEKKQPVRSAGVHAQAPTRDYSRSA